MEVEELLTKIETVVTEWRKAEAIAQQDEIGAGKGLEITFRKVTVGEEYYRCVLIELNGQSSRSHQVLSHRISDVLVAKRRCDALRHHRGARAF